MKSDISDHRLVAPQCTSLLPVDTVHKNQWFTVCNRGGYYTIEHNHPQVMILPIVDQKAIVMVRAYRPIIADTPLELPSGGAIEGEIPVEAARRELSEETGITIHDVERFEVLSPFGAYPTKPAISSLFSGSNYYGRI